MEKRKFEGRSEREALENAADGFGKAADEVAYEVVKEVARGPFGIMGKHFVIEAWVRPEEAKERHPAEEQEHACEAAEGARQEDAGARKEAVPVEMPAGAAGERKDQEPEEELEDVDAETAAAGRGAPPSELAEEARGKLAEILRLMGVDQDVAVEETDREIRLDVRGNAGGIIIGAKGQTLDALQFIMERIVSHIAGSRKKVLLDANDYRRRRIRQLQALAEKLSRKAIETRRIVTVDDMSARDRRIIHMALEGVRGISTCSEGEGEYKRLLIVPVQERERQCSRDKER